MIFRIFLSLLLSSAINASSPTASDTSEIDLSIAIRQSPSTISERSSISEKKVKKVSWADQQPYHIVTLNNENIIIGSDVIKYFDKLRKNARERLEKDSRKDPMVSSLILKYFLSICAKIPHGKMDAALYNAELVRGPAASISTKMDSITMYEYMEQANALGLIGIPLSIFLLQVIDRYYAQKQTWLPCSIKALSPFALHRIPKCYRSRFLKLHYLHIGTEMDFTEAGMKQPIYKLSIHELYDWGRGPKTNTTEKGPMLDLSSYHITSVEGLGALPNVDKLAVLRMNFNLLENIIRKPLQCSPNLELEHDDGKRWLAKPVTQFQNYMDDN